MKKELAQFIKKYDEIDKKTSEMFYLKHYVNHTGNIKLIVQAFLDHWILLGKYKNKSELQKTLKYKYELLSILGEKANDDQFLSDVKKYHKNWNHKKKWENSEEKLLIELWLINKDYEKNIAA